MKGVHRAVAAYEHAGQSYERGHPDHPESAIEALCLQTNIDRSRMRFSVHTVTGHPAIRVVPGVLPLIRLLGLDATAPGVPLGTPGRCRHLHRSVCLRKCDRRALARRAFRGDQPAHIRIRGSCRKGWTTGALSDGRILSRGAERGKPRVNSGRSRTLSGFSCLTRLPLRGAVPHRASVRSSRSVRTSLGSPPAWQQST